MSSSSKRISIIIPIYNESKNIELLHDSLLIHLQKIKKFNYEVIFINDGSNDDSWSLIKNIIENNNNFKGISFSRNFGYQCALTAGYDIASGDAIITMDADLQHPPSLIEKMIEEWQSGNLIVYAQRIDRNDGFLKKITANWYYKIFSLLSDISIPRNVSDFRLIDTKVLSEIKKMNEKARYLRGIVAWTGFNYSFVAFKQPARLIGFTKYTWSKLLKIALDGIFGFCKAPFKLVIYIALFVFFNSLLLMIYQVVTICLLHTFTGSIFLHWSTIIMYCMVSLQLYLIGLFGIFLSTIYDKVKKRPSYIILEKINFSHERQ